MANQFEGMTEEKPVARALVALEEYLEVLADEYPNPINASSLARKMNKSKAAVTKVRARLLWVCDRTKMALDRAFVLRLDLDTAYLLLLVSAANGRHRSFLASKFVKSLVSPKRIHARIATAFPLYATYFEEADTAFVVQKGLEALSAANPESLRSVARAMSKPTSFLNTTAWLRGTQQVLGNLRLTLKDDAELKQVISIRDKLFFLVREYLWRAMQNMQILKDLPPEHRDSYVAVYKHTIDFYLRRIFEALNEPIMRACQEAGFPMAGPPQIGSSVLRMNRDG